MIRVGCCFSPLPPRTAYSDWPRLAVGLAWLSLQVSFPPPSSVVLAGFMPSSSISVLLTYFLILLPLLPFSLGPPSYPTIRVTKWDRWVHELFWGQETPVGGTERVGCWDPVVQDAEFLCFEEDQGLWDGGTFPSLVRTE